MDTVTAPAIEPEPGTGRHTATLGMLRMGPAAAVRLSERLGLAGFGVAAAGLDDDLIAELAARTADAGLTVNCLSHGIRTPPGPGAAWARERSALAAAVDRAARLGAPTLLITSGPSAGLDWLDAADRLTWRLGEQVRAAARAGVTIAVENTMSMRAELSFTHRVADAADLAEMLGAGVVVDLYSAWQERDLARTLARHRDRIALVQMADLKMPIHSVPNRWALGDGDLPIAGQLTMLGRLGLDTSIDLELLGPAIDEIGLETALARSLTVLGGHRSPAAP